MQLIGGRVPMSSFSLIFGGLSNSGVNFNSIVANKRTRHLSSRYRSRGDVAIWKLPAVCFFPSAGLYCCVHHDTNRPAQRKQKKMCRIRRNTKTRLTIDRKQFGGPFTTTSGYTFQDHPIES